MTTALVAWQSSTDPDDNWEITFAPADAGEGERAPEFDPYAPGPVPASALLAAGWWMECSHCSRHVSADGPDDWGDEDGEDGDAPDPVCVGESVYCDSRCRDKEQAEQAARRARKAAMEADALKRWPGIEVLSVYDDSLEFRFLGQRWTTQWLAADPGHVSMPPADVPLWTAWKAR